MDTTKLDDLLNQAEAQEAEQGEWIEDIKYTTKNFYVDEHGVVDIKNKIIGDMSKHISVKGESYSQYIEFKIGRFFDGIDLTKMQLAIYYIVPGVGEDESRPINVYYNENEIKFGWVIPPEVAQTNLTIEFCIYARGKLSDGNNYILKTKTAKYSINDGLEIGSGIIEPTNNWYLNFVLEIDEKVAQASESANRAEQATSSLDGVVETVTTARDEVVQKASTVDTQHSEVESWHQESEQFRNEAEQFRNQAEAITGIGLAEEGKPGIVQPDGVTTKVDENGKLIVIGGGSGGGGTPGTTDYEDLNNKPKINGVELSGDKTLEELGFEGTIDYQALENKPSIAGIELNGDKSYDELGLASKDAVARNFETVNQSIQDLDDYTQSLGEDIVSLDIELEATKENLNSTTFKVETIIEKADLGIKETASGEEIHLTDSADGKAVEFALYGKSSQNTTSGKNLFGIPIVTSHDSLTSNGLTCQMGETLIINGTATAEATFCFYVKDGMNNGVSSQSVFVLSGSCSQNVVLRTYEGNWNGKLTACNTSNDKPTNCNSENIGTIMISFTSGTVCTDCEIGIQIEKGTDLTVKEYEPYTNGASPNPNYPQEIEVSGESYNLLENTATSQTIAGITYTVENGIVNVNGTSTSAYSLILNPKVYLEKGSYVLSGGYGSLSNPQGYPLITCNAILKDGTKISDFITNLKGAVTVDDTIDYLENVRIFVNNEITINNVTVYPMIRKASVTNDRYMPYGKGSVEVTSKGKNLFDKANSQTIYGDNTNGYWVINNSDTMYGRVFEAEIKPNTDYTISNYSDGDYFRIVLSKKQLDNNKNTDSIQIINKTSSSINQHTFNSGEYTRCYFAVNGATNSAITTVKAQLEEGKVATEYQEFKETLSTIPTENGLAGIKVSSGGNYTDQNGQQWICDEVVKFADGSGEKIQRVNVDTYDYIDMFYQGGPCIRIPDKYHDNSSWAAIGKAMCSLSSKQLNFTDLCTASKNLHNYDCYAITGTSSGYYLYCIYIPTIEQTIEAYNEFLSNTPITFVSVKPEPIITPLTAEELAEIEKLHTFYPVTNISNDFDCGMKVMYKCDGKNYIDNKLAQIAAAVVNNI